jgi:hypothetical protein
MGKWLGQMVTLSVQYLRQFQKRKGIVLSERLAVVDCLGRDIPPRRHVANRSNI